ncbi:neutral zinc metallopeptidase [Aquabacterium sp.]|uniref:KPN_02809 family neutral zinc metallopeptidase n=1 Tax=Aquabacterium sp. TaxID=1872578 RepID=UPI002BA08578|nr:neutral zinc metallopeptidase [Aquabacterium sp.]HSW07731.1 neutral zinc metallopeptidase [Aquabacterium sp.]
MRLDGHRESDNVEDARQGGGGGGSGFIGGRSIGIGTVAIALIGGWIFGINPLTVLSLLSGGSPAPVAQQAPATKPPAGDPMARFVSMVLADTEDVWREQFRAAGSTYREPKLRLYKGREVTACGSGQAAMGPFYCPGDEKIYIDLSFYEDMRTRMGAPGDFAQAYVIAHEVGHHVQHLAGISDKVEQARRRSSPQAGNALSVRLELQADCYAGVWAHHAQRARQILEQGDVEEALNAASQIGDDTLQKKGQGRVVPENFTHGTSAQRVSWFKRGMASGSVDQCDTFKAGANL